VHVVAHVEMPRNILLGCNRLCTILAKKFYHGLITAVIAKINKVKRGKSMNKKKENVKLAHK
jgi:hypothetical protein